MRRRVTELPNHRKIAAAGISLALVPIAGLVSFAAYPPKEEIVVNVRGSSPS